MDNTYQELYKNENRAIRIKLYDKDRATFDPDSAYSTIYDSNNEIVRVERGCMTDSTSVWDIVSTTVTATVGEYYILWKIIKNNYIYYHRTNLRVSDVF